MHNIKAIFFDLDGTVIDPNTHNVPQSTIDAIFLAAQKGIKLFIATGRRYETIRDMPQLMQFPWSGYICSNGQCIHDQDGTQIKGYYFTPTQVEELVTFCRLEQMSLTLVSPAYNLAPLGIDDYMIEAHSFFHEPLPEVIKPYHNEDIFMALIYNKMDYPFDKVENVAGLKALPNQSTYADVVLRSVSKATGIDTMCQLHCIPKEHTMAFGDGGNDIEMLQHVSIGVAMGNACIELKEQADYITDDVDNDGITKALLHFNIV